MQLFDFKGREANDLRETFGDLPLIEARDSMIVYVSKQDIATAVRGDPRNCVFARSCQRAFGSRAVLFYPTVAYVDMLDEEGERVVMRFRVNGKTREQVERFDREEDVLEATFKLQPISKTQTLTYKSKKRKARDKALADGTHEVNPLRVEGTRKGWQTRRNKALMGLRLGGPNHPGTPTEVEA